MVYLFRLYMGVKLITHAVNWAMLNILVVDNVYRNLIFLMESLEAKP